MNTDSISLKGENQKPKTKSRAHLRLRSRTAPNSLASKPVVRCKTAENSSLAFPAFADTSLILKTSGKVWIYSLAQVDQKTVRLSVISKPGLALSRKHSCVVPTANPNSRPLNLRSSPNQATRRLRLHARAARINQAIPKQPNIAQHRQEKQDPNSFY